MTSIDDPITAGQVKSLKSGLNQISGMKDEAHLYIIRRFLRRKHLDSFEGIKVWEYKKLRSMLFPNYRSRDYSLDAGIRIEIAMYLGMWLEENS